MSSCLLPKAGLATLPRNASRFLVPFKGDVLPNYELGGTATNNQEARSLQKELQTLAPLNILAIESFQQTEASLKELIQKAIAHRSRARGTVVRNRELYY